MNADRQAFLNAIAMSPDDTAPKGIFADWLDEQEEHEEATLYRSWKPNRIIKELANNYSWTEAFGYAGEPDTCATKDHGGPLVQPTRPGHEVSVALFGLKDVKRVIGLREGQNDERNWLCVGELYDGRWFALDAGCDYTGWD